MTKPITTTLEAVRQYVTNGDWQRLLHYKGETYPHDKPLHLSTIVEAIGLHHACSCFWKLPTIKQYKHLLWHFIADTLERAESVHKKKYPDDKRLRKGIQSTRDYADGKIVEKEWVDAMSVPVWDDALRNINAIVNKMEDDAWKPGSIESRELGELFFKRFG